MTEDRVLITTSAANELEAVGAKADRQRTIGGIRSLGANPRAQGSEELAGYSDRYRMRQENYRIIYLADEHAREVTVFKIGQRKDVYR